MARFAISHHVAAPDGDHFDLFLEADLVLKTWRISKSSFTEPQSAKPAADHRLTYLEFEGDIPGGKRGRVSLWDRGLYTVDRWEESLIQVAVAGAKLRTRLRLTKKGDEWTLVDVTTAARQQAIALLRGAALEPAPVADLEEFQLALAAEERRILAAVDRFNKGAQIEWPVRPADPALRDRIAKARARWRHRWLDAAATYFDGLEKLSLAVKA
jgi:hypothetical protein